VLAHGANEEHSLFNGIVGLHLITLEAIQSVPGEMGQQQHRDDQQREPSKQ
jgi:hypothetical protein